MRENAWSKQQWGLLLANPAALSFFLSSSLPCGTVENTFRACFGLRHIGKKEKTVKKKCSHCWSEYRGKEYLGIFRESSSPYSSRTADNYACMTIEGNNWKIGYSWRRIQPSHLFIFNFKRKRRFLVYTAFYVLVKIWALLQLSFVVQCRSEVQWIPEQWGWGRGLCLPRELLLVLFLIYML